MARSKNSKAAPARVPVDVGSTGTRPVPKSAVALLIVSILAALWAVAMMTTPGKVAYLYLYEYLKFYMGVVALVFLSITIMVGLVATDRLVLSIRQRVLLQSAHRTTGVIAVSGLFVHVWTKFIDGQVGVIDFVIPFLVDGRELWIGLGTISGWVMVLVMWSGLARARFIGRGKPWMWRGIHAISYLIWPTALLHGLNAGRPAAVWVIVSYVVCVLSVLIGLAVRLSVSLNRRKDFASPAGVGAVRPQETGELLPTASAPIRRPNRSAAVDLLAPAGAEPATMAPPAWNQPSAGPSAPAWNQPSAPAARPVSAAPAARPVSAAPAARPVSAAPAAAPVEDDYDYPPRGRRQPELDAPAPRQRRAVEDDERYDTQTRMSRRDLDDDRYRYDDEPAPRSRGRRFEDDEPSSRPRRRDDAEATGTRMRRFEDDVESTGARMRRDDLESTGARMRRFEDDDSAPRGRRREPEYDERPRGRRRADDEYEDVPPARGARYEEEPAPRSRSDRYDEPRFDEPSPRRQSRSEFVDFADGPAYPVDDTPTLVDSGSRRSRRDDGGRRGRDDADEGYFSQLRGDSRDAR